MDKIFCVATIQGLDIKYERTVGYFLTLEDAREVVEKNRCDIHENCYDYAVIEEVEPGLYSADFCSNVIFYKWDNENNQYVEVNRPSEWKDLCGFTMG